MWRTKLSVFPFFFPKSPRQACFRRIFSVFRRPEFAIHGDKPAQVENFFEIVRHIIKIQQQCVEFPDASSRRRGRPGRCRAPSSFDLPRAGLGPASAPQSTGLFRPRRCPAASNPFARVHRTKKSREQIPVFSIMVDPKGFEPSASALRTRRSPS